jgi:Spy/CpxP family protein refolding chaperone
MKRLLVIAIGAATVIALVAGGALYSVSASNKEAARWENALFAQEGNAGGHGVFKHRIVGRILAHISSELKLNEQQKTEIHGIFAAERQNVLPLLRQLHETKKQYVDASASGGTFDEAKAREFASRQAQTITELIVAKERVRSKVFAVLTPEQRARAKEMHDRFAARIGEHLGG